MIQRSLPDLKAAIQQNGIQIGRGGIFIQGVCENEKLGETQFKITFSSGELHFIEGQGIVRWLRKKGTENLPTGLGIEFTYLPENIRNQVLEYIRLNNPVPFIPNGPKSKS
jgi:Tfp pilus assembly protein PilZ